MRKRYRNQMKQIIAMLLVCAMLTGIIPASLPETVHAAAVSAAEQEKWYEVTAKISSSWGGHIAGEITLTNNSEETIQDWQIEFPWDALITCMWSGNYEATENGYIITPADYNRELAAGASVSIGFMAEGEDAVLEEVVAEGFFGNHGVHITTAEERENMPPEPSREPEPTLEATVSPMVEPTVSLTATPTLEATASPTVEPTATPAPEATASPAVEPTVTPTPEPTATPTPEPTASPTVEPTTTPTPEPTASPTVEPTATPTPETTASPTVEPTATPTPEPTATPTLEPTASPTIVPTAEPTEEPTAEPIEDFYVYTDTTLTEDLTCRNLFLMGGALTVKDCTITVQGDYIQTEKSCTLQNGTMDIRGNAHVAAGTLTAREQSVFRTDGTMDVSGNSLSFINSKLMVQGDLAVESGCLSIDPSGQVSVAGDLRVSDSGCLNIRGTRGTAEVKVAGDLTIDSVSRSQLAYGSLILGGDLIQTENAAENSLAISDSFQLIFRSEEGQKISLPHPETTTLGTMDFRESAGVEVPDEVHGREIYGFEKIGKKEKLSLYLSYVSMQQDEIVPCNSIDWYGTRLCTNQYRLTVKGDINLYTDCFESSRGSFEVYGDCRSNMRDSFRLANAEMGVHGDMTVKNSCLSIDPGGQLAVDGSLRVSDAGWMNIRGTREKAEIKVAGNLEIDSESQSQLAYGSLILGGDLIQTENAAENSLAASDSFQLIFRSGEQQEISLSHPETTTLGTMDFRESAGVEVPDEVHGREIYGFKKIGKKEKLSLYLSYVSMQQDEIVFCNSIDWHGSRLYTNQYCLTVKGDINLYTDCFGSSRGRLEVYGDCRSNMSDSFRLSNAEVRVHGDMTVENSCLSIDPGGQLAVDGNLRVSDTAWLNIRGSREKAEIKVAGDLTIDSESQSQLAYGSLTLGGDLIQTEDSAEDSLKIGSSFNLILNGKEEQTISLWDEEAVLGSLDLSGCTSLIYDGEFYGSEIRGIERISDSCEIVSHCTRNIATGNGSIAGDLYIDGELSFEEGASLTLGADFYHDGSLNMVGGTLKVKGDYDAESSVVDVTDGSLTVEGDMHVKSDASLSLKTPKSRLDVRGNLNISSMKTGDNQMTEGVIRIGGDINCSEYASTESFSLNGTKLVLNGKEPQEVFIYYDSDRAPYEIDMTESVGVTFRNSAISAKSIKGWDKIRNENIVIQDLQQNLEQDEVFHGDLFISGEYLNLAGHDFVVEGKLTLFNAILCPNEGLLKTGGNYSMLDSRLVMINTADRLQIGGDFWINTDIDHTNLIQRGRIGLYGNYYEYGNPRAFNSEKEILVAFMGDYTHYYCFSHPFHSKFYITYGKAEEIDEPYEIDETVANAIFYGLRAGLLELTESPDEVLAAAAIGAAAGLGITLATAAAPEAMAYAAIIGIIFTIYEFCQDFKYICGIDGTYQKIREATKLATIFAVTAIAGGLGAKIGGAAGSAASGKVHEVSMAVENEIKNQKIWKSTCEWMKKNVLENAKAFTDDVKNLLNEAVVGKIKGWLDNSKALQLYKYQTLTVDDILQELAGILDQDACSYLRRNCSGPKDIKKLRKISVCSVFAEKAKGCKLNKFDIQYIDSVFATLSQEEINRTVSFLENAVSDQILAENSEALKFLKNIYQQKSHFNRIHKIFDSARLAAEVKGGPLTEVEARYINKVYAESGKQKIPQGEIDSYFKIISKGYDFSDLKNVGAQFDQDTLEHIFAGQLNDNIEAVGYHYVGEQDTAGSIIPGTKISKNKFGGYKAEVKVAGIKKEQLSSFFPDSMSRQDVVDVINQAYANMTLVKGRRYHGTAMYQGYKMYIEIHLKANGKIETAYPLY